MIRPGGRGIDIDFLGKLLPANAGNGPVKNKKKSAKKNRTQ